LGLPLIEKQVGPVIRVVGQSKIIFQQLSKLTDQTDGYQPMYVKNMEEAEVLLADLAERKPES
jgi:hypothetical protein